MWNKVIDDWKTPVEYIDREAANLALAEQGFDWDKAKQALASVPAADVASVVHGRWSESKEHFYLNNGCKEWINFYCSECDAPNNSPTDYCPHCGAKMDGGADNA